MKCRNMITLAWDVAKTVLIVASISAFFVLTDLNRRGRRTRR